MFAYDLRQCILVLSNFSTDKDKAEKTDFFCGFGYVEMANWEKQILCLSSPKIMTTCDDTHVCNRPLCIIMSEIIRRRIYIFSIERI